MVAMYCDVFAMCFEMLRTVDFISQYSFFVFFEIRTIGKVFFYFYSFNFFFGGFL